ncbi:MAG TPA: aspartyl protease family protein [Candidatus Acidoferrum sp.]|nr:aspartyl protease family protein [Candidatus Acidoferrum sp.]
MLKRFPSKLQPILLFAVLAICLSVNAQLPTADSLATADKLFQAGKFDEAQRLFSKINAKKPKDFASARQLGHLYLLSNQLDAAQKWLERALTLKPNDPDVKIMLAEVFYRQDDFDKAAVALSGIDSQDADRMRSYQSLVVPKLLAFQGQTPYELYGEGDLTHLKFIKTDPLPLVHVRINGGREVVFFIDTGGSELLLDTQFAQELGVESLGAVKGTFSGGMQAEVGNGRIDSVTLGDWTVKNVPVGILALRALSEDFGVPQLNGCVGTNVLYHFLSTLDYPAGELVLRRKTPESVERFVTSLSATDQQARMWLVGDHFMVAWGQVEKIPPSLFFIDTGLAGAGLKLAESTIKQAGITLREDKASVGAGGGGKLKIVPYEVKEFSLGSVTQENVAGLYDGAFSWESAWGFHVDGMVGHDFFRHYAVTFDFTNMRLILH